MRLVPLLAAAAVALTLFTASPSEASLPPAQQAWAAQTDRCRHLQEAGNIHGVHHCMFDRFWAGDTRQHECVDRLQDRENRYRDVRLKNRHSSAYGIPMALAAKGDRRPGSKMKTHGLDWQTSALVQVSWMASYILDRYGSPCGALRHHQRRGWY